MLESIERLRNRMKIRACIVSFEKTELLEQLDAIEREVKERYIELPKDADGVTIHVGDWITGRWDAKAKVVAVTSDDAYWWEPDGCHWCHSFEVHHYHKPTVEDMLREFAEKWGDMSYGSDEERELFAEYAKRLQLREE